MSINVCTFEIAIALLCFDSSENVVGRRSIMAIIIINIISEIILCKKIKYKENECLNFERVPLSFVTINRSCCIIIYLKLDFKM